MSTSSETRDLTPDEQFRMLFKRTAKLNDAVSALLDPKWGAQAGILPEGHPLHPGAPTESEEHGAPVDWQAVVQRRECELKTVGEARHRAEAAVQRVTALRDRWVQAGPPPLGTPLARWWDARLVELNAALDEPKEQCGAGSTAPNALGNERCTLPAGHDGRHAEGITTWPRDPARA